MLTGFLSLSIVASGSAIFFFFHRKEPSVTLSLNNCFDILFAGILAASALGILLLIPGLFSPASLAIALVALTVCLAPFAWPRVPIKIDSSINRYFVFLLVLLTFSLIFRVEQANWIRGGQDQGIYTNLGNYIARTGSVKLHDDVLDMVRDNRNIREYYVRQTYFHTTNVQENKYEGAYTPGIYVKDLDRGALVPQFYHLHPMWLSISSTLLGRKHVTGSLLLFSLMGIVLLYRLTAVVQENRYVALASAAMLAVNPLHSYFTRVAVTEVLAAMYVLGGMYYLARTYQERGNAFTAFMAIFSFGGFFFTRITGFIFLLPVLFLMYHATLFNRHDKRRHLVLSSLLGIIVLYILSAAYGYTYSYPYFFDVFNRTLHIDVSNRTVLVCLALGLAGAMLPLAFIRRLRSPFRRLRCLLASHRVAVLYAIFTFLFILVIYKGYLFAFTSTISDPLWHIAGGGFRALLAFNMVVLAIMLTPPGLIICLYGLHRSLRKWFYSDVHLLVGGVSLFMLALYTLIKYKAPNLHYYSRYLLSETIPLLLVFFGGGLSYIYLKYRRTAWVLLAVVLVASMGMSALHVRVLVHDEVFLTFEALDKTFDNDAIIFLDHDIQPDTERMVAPLKLTFNRNIFVFRESDIINGTVHGIINYFTDKGYRINIVSNNGHLDVPGFSLSATVPVTSEFRPPAYENISVYKNL